MKRSESVRLKMAIRRLTVSVKKNTITDVMNKVSSDINKKGIGEVYEQLLAISRKLQYKQLVEAGALGRLPFIGIDLLDKDTARVVFQGTEGAYSQAAMEHYFGKDCNNYHVHTFREAMEAIEEGAADYAVLPIENSTAGAVNEIYDLLVEFENYIVGETIIPIKNTLSGLPGTDISEIERVYSKAEALMQASHFWEIMVTGSRSVWQIPHWRQRRSWKIKISVMRQCAVHMRHLCMVCPCLQIISMMKRTILPDLS